MKQNVYDYSFEMREIRRRKITAALLVVGSVILFLSLFLSFILFPVHVKTDSMESDIAKNSALFVCPLVKTPHRGDVMYITRLDGKKIPWYGKLLNRITSIFTAQQYAPIGHNNRMTGKDSIRRVLALPGDTIYMKDYVLYIKPKGENLFLTEFELASKPYNIHIYSIPVEWDGMGAVGNLEETTLGDGEYFVLADNRIEAVDSRVYGKVPASRIQGKVIFEYFPFTKLRLF